MHKIFGWMVVLLVSFVLQSPSALADQAAPLLLPSNALRGPIGPFPNAVVMVHKRGEENLFASIVALDGDKTASFTVLLASWSSFESPSIDAGQADKDADIELLIVGTFMSGVGPDGAQEFSHAVVLDWQTDKFVVVDVDTPKKTKSIFTAREIAKFSGFKFTR